MKRELWPLSVLVKFVGFRPGSFIIHKLLLLFYYLDTSNPYLYVKDDMGKQCGRIVCWMTPEYSKPKHFSGQDSYRCIGYRLNWGLDINKWRMSKFFKIYREIGSKFMWLSSVAWTFLSLIFRCSGSWKWMRERIT